MRDGRVVLVTGGTRGIGRACVLDAARTGATVAFCGRNGDWIGPVEREAAALGAPGTLGVVADVSREDDVIRFFDAARDRFGEIHAVIHNAAISRESLLVAATDDDVDAVVDTDLTGSFLVVRQAVRAFLERSSGGRLVLIGTLSQNGARGNAVYAAAKGGAGELVRVVSDAYGSRGIVANSVVSGYAKTDLSESLPESARRALVEGCPLRRSASPEEIAAVAMFLLSDAGSGIRGQAVFATGGLLEVPS